MYLVVVIVYIIILYMGKTGIDDVTYIYTDDNPLDMLCKDVIRPEIPGIVRVPDTKIYKRK